MDLRLALRRLLAAPVFTAFAVLSLAVGVSVTTAAYSVVRSIFLKDLGIRDPGEIAFVVMPWGGRLLRGSVSNPDFQDLRAAQTSFSRLSASSSFQAAVSSSSATELESAEAVDGAYFATLGVTAAVGRVIQESDDRSGAQVVVLSQRLWRVRFAEDRAIVGQTVRISGRPFEVIGVAAAPFEGAIGLPAGGTSLWIPLMSETFLASPKPPVSARDWRRLRVFGRLNPSVSVANASAELAAIARDLDAAFPPPNGLRATERPWNAKSLAAIVEDDNWLHRFGLTLVALIALVLAVACTNLSNLVLARGMTRQRELTVRRALGASRWRLVREQMTESLLIAMCGALVSWAFFHGLRMLMATDFYFPLPFGGHLTLEVRPALDPSALGVAAACLLISLAVFGLEPAVQLTRTLDISGALAASGSAGRSNTGRQRALLRWQVAVATGFFIVATMFVRFTIQEARHDSGVALGPLAVATLDFRTQQWDETRVRLTLDRVLEEVRKDQSVEETSISTGMPFGPSAGMRLEVSRLDAVSTGYSASAIAATPSIFNTLGVPILRGRGFDDRDHAAAERVVVLNEIAARQIVGTVDAVGQRMVVQRRPQPSFVATVIGVARDTDVGFMSSEPRPFVYIPFAQHYDPYLTIAMRSRTDATRAVGALRTVLHRVEPALAVDAIGTGRAILDGPFEVLRALGRATLALGMLTLLLAMIGLFGIQSHLVANRTREIGVRMSLGASAAQVKRMVIADGYRPVADGLVLGLFGGLAGRVLVRTYLDIDVVVVDPWMLLITPIPVILAAFCACYFPARRAAAVDPNVALHCD